jgi:hypothetical protein
VKNIWRGAVALSVVFFLARPVLADEAPFGQGARGAIAVESLFGFAHQTTTLSGPFGSNASQSQDVFTLLGGGTGSYGIPRLGADLLVGSSISLGASAFFGLISPASGSTTVLQFNPRIGALVKVSRAVAIWPRIGFDYLRNATSSSSNASTTTTLYSLRLEAPVLIAAVNHLAVVITPVVELGLGGSSELKNGTMSLTADQKVTQLGVVLGFLMFL